MIAQEPSIAEEKAIEKMEQEYEEQKTEEPKPLPAWTKKQYRVTEKELPGREGIYLINRSCKHCHGTGIIGYKIEQVGKFILYCRCPIKKEESQDEKETE